MNGHFREFEDEYLEMMYQFYEKKPGNPVRNGDLAASLGVSPASATEMIQRLASKGLVDYVPYKGATLTESGMIHGKKMKRRHRLAEVFLESVSFQGNTHATACRLEHAIDDDLEIALTQLLGNPVLDPSGRDIPSASSEIMSRVESSETRIQLLSALDGGASGVIQAMFFGQDDREVLAHLGIEIGTEIASSKDGYSVKGAGEVEISPELASKLIVRVV